MALTSMANLDYARSPEGMKKALNVLNTAVDKVIKQASAGDKDYDDFIKCLDNNWSGDDQKAFKAGFESDIKKLTKEIKKLNKEIEAWFEQDMKKFKSFQKNNASNYKSVL